MVTRLDLFYVKSLLEKTALGGDSVKAKAAKKILGNKELILEYTNMYISKRDRRLADKQNVNVGQ